MAYSKGSDVTPDGRAGEPIDPMLGLKARLGVAADRALFYGVLGYSQIDYDAGVDGQYSAKGPAFGLGVDYAVTDRLTLDIDLNTVALRVGLNF